MAMAGSSESRNWVDFAAARPGGEPTAAEVIGAGFTHNGQGQFPVRGAGAFEAGGPADIMAPCSVLAELTGQALEAGLERLSDDELVGVMRAARRVASWQAAVELAAVDELAARRAKERHDAGPRPAERASAEIAVALTLTARSADALTELASGLAKLQDVATALTRGEIDVARATVFVDELSALPWLQASMIASRHLMIAGDLTTSQLRSLLRRAVLAADPAADRRRQREARRDAQVQAWTEMSGNAAIAGRELPASRALLADKHISALAKSLKAAGMPGTLDQVRAEVFLALLSGQSPESLLAAGLADSPGTREAGIAGADGAGGAGGGSQPHAGPSASAGLSWPAGPLGTVHLTVPLSTWLGVINNPGDIAGHGPADAWTCRELADSMIGRSGTRYCLSVTTPDGHPLGHACTSVPPPTPATGSAGPAPPGPAPGPEPSGLAGPVSPHQVGRRMLPGDVAAWISGLAVEWLEAGTCNHSRQTQGYRPGKFLDHLIKVRNSTCTAPGCRRAAQQCDLDHLIPYDQGGLTCECNLHPQCRRHHRCKGSAGWQVEMPEPGVLAWRLPHGRSYMTRAEAYPV
jgi:hypothetical protein